jgi:sporulation related protein
MNIRSIIPVVLCSSVLLTGCNTAENDWNKATASNTVAAYQGFLQEHGSDKHADNARGRILALQDDQAWTTARTANTVEAYDEYLKIEGGGVHAQQAQYYVTALRRAADWESIKDDADDAALQAFLQKYPQGLEANQARSKLKDLNYRVELANARSKASAERKRAQLQVRFGKVLHDIVVLAPSGSGTLFRVTSGPMSQATASSACASLERAHQRCKLIEGTGTPG